MMRWVLFLFLFGCNVSSNPCQTGYAWDQFDYDVVATSQTPINKIQVDASGNDISLELVDEIYEEVIACLEDTFPGGEMSRKTRYAGICFQESWVIPPEGSVTLKIPGQYVMSCPGENRQQLLLDEAPGAGCVAKGLEPDLDCLCRWRAGIQDTCTAVTTPSLYMLKDPLVKILTGCTYIWNDPELAKCASPSVPMLPEGNL